MKIFTVVTAAIISLYGCVLDNEGTLTVSNYTSQVANAWGVTDDNTEIPAGFTNTFHFKNAWSVGAGNSIVSKTINSPSGHETIALIP